MLAACSAGGTAAAAPLAEPPPFPHLPGESGAGLRQAVPLPNFDNAVAKRRLDVRYRQTRLQGKPQQSSLSAP